MKSLFVLLAFTYVSLSTVFAQKTSTSQPSSTAGSSSTPVTTNRQQNLYDHYHSYSKKNGTDPAPVTTTNRVDTERPAPTSTAPSEGSRRQSEPMGPGGDASSPIRIGVRGGVTYPIYLEQNTGFKPAIGFVGGIVFTLGKGAVSFQPEVNYARFSEKSSDLYGTYTTSLDVIEVPLLVKFSTGTYEGHRFFVNVGPYASYLASASFEGRKIPLSGLKGRYGFGAAAGIGAALKAGPGHVTVEVRGMYSLGDTDFGFTTDSKTILGEGTVGYIFPLGRSR